MSQILRPTRGEGLVGNVSGRRQDGSECRADDPVRTESWLQRTFTRCRPRDRGTPTT